MYLIQAMHQTGADLCRPHPCSVLLWDVGGTLVDTSISPDEAADRALLSAGVNPAVVTLEAREAARLRLAEAEVLWRTLLDEEQGFCEIAALLLDNSRIAADYLLIKKLGRAIGGYFDLYRPIAGINNLLEELTAYGIRQAVVSNWPPSLNRFLKHHHFDGYFEVIVGSGREGVMKPDTSLLQRALDRLEIKPSQAVFVGNDPQLDILPARTLGLRAVHFDPRREYLYADAYDAAVLRVMLRAILRL
jgi:HAD superfamily hydrolase (TIGR01549 family)